MLYLDCADPDALGPLLATGLFDGVTTNPSVLSKANKGFNDIPALYQFAHSAGARLFFAQAVGTTVTDIRRSADQILSLGDGVRVKIGCTQAGLTVARELAAQGHDVLVTALFHPVQTLAAMAAGATWIAPYVSRAESAGTDIDTLVGQSKAMIAQALSPMRILAASLHSLDQCSTAAAAGADDITLNADGADALLEEPQTLEAMSRFEQVNSQR